MCLKKGAAFEQEKNESGEIWESERDEKGSTSSKASTRSAAASADASVADSVAVPINPNEVAPLLCGGGRRRDCLADRRSVGLRRARPRREGKSSRPTAASHGLASRFGLVPIRFSLSLNRTQLKPEPKSIDQTLIQLIIRQLNHKLT